MIDTNEILQIIYKIAFKRDTDTSVNVFLCGLDPESGESIRNKIYNKIKSNPRINVVFPEWLFSNLLTSEKHNLLTLERELAENVDVIIIPLEGIGTIAELGAFSSFEGLAKKIIVINDNKYKRKRSFINQGPIKIIRDNNKNNIVYFNRENLDKVIENISNRIIYFRKYYQLKKLTNFFDLSRFLLYIIAVFQPCDKQYLEKIIKEFDSNIPDYYLEPCIEILFDKKYIKLSNFDKSKKEEYILSEFGNDYVYENLLYQLSIVKIFSELRTKVLDEKRKEGKKFNLEVKRAKILVAR